MFVDEFIRKYVLKEYRKDFLEAFYKYSNETHYAGIWYTKDVLFMLLEKEWGKTF